MAACGAEDTLLLTLEGLVLAAGKGGGREGFVCVSGLEGVTRVFCSTFMAALTAERTAWVWGEAWDALPCPVTEFANRVLDIAVGRDFIVLLDQDLLVYTRGSNSHGQLGCPEVSDGFACVHELCSQPVKNVFCGPDFVVCLAGVRLPAPQPAASQEKTPPAREGGSLETLREFQRNMYDLLNDIRAKVPNIHENVDPGILERLLHSEQQLNAVFSQTTGTRSPQPGEDAHACRIDELLREFQREFPRGEADQAFAAQLAGMRQLLKFDNSNLLFLAQRAKVVGERIAACVESVDREAAAVGHSQ